MDDSTTPLSRIHGNQSLKVARESCDHLTHSYPNFPTHIGTIRSISVNVYAPPLSIMFRPLATRALLFSRASTRSFHSPYVVLRDSRLTSPLASPAASSMNEKQNDHSAEPFLTHAGTRTYVVSEPDATSKHYQVPSGAYPTSGPYVGSVSSETSPARPATIHTMTRNEGDIRESSATKLESGESGNSFVEGDGQPGSAQTAEVTPQGGLANAWRTRR